MRRLSIVGAGEIGATIALKLAERDWPGAITLIGQDAGVTEGKALDLLQANPVLGSGTRISAARDLSPLRESHLIVLADAPGLDGESVDRGLVADIMVEAGYSTHHPPVLIAASDPVPLLHSAHAAGKVPADRFIGISPIALASRWRYHLARAIGCSPRDLQVSVIGAPPEPGCYEILASAGGRPIEDLLPITDLRTAAREVETGRPSGPRGLATAACSLLRGMERRCGTLHSCYIWVRELEGVRDIFACMPALFGAGGARVLSVPLEPARRVTVARGIDALVRRQRGAFSPPSRTYI